VCFFYRNIAKYSFQAIYIKQQKKMNIFTLSEENFLKMIFYENYFPD